jgi:two-component system, NarL family, nitrate/nitrite response regulator NarL
MATKNNLGSTPISVLLIDSHQISLWGVQTLIDRDDRFAVCGSAANTKEAIAQTAKHSPDVIILEPDLCNEDGLDLISKLIELSNAKIIVLTSLRDLSVHDLAVVRGARGVLTKMDSPETLLKAIEKIHEGELWVNRNATSRILMQIAAANTPKEVTVQEKRLASLTVKEKKVVHAIHGSSEKTLKQVADKLHISEHTLRNHLASVYEKLEVRNRLELYVFCNKYMPPEVIALPIAA